MAERMYEIDGHNEVSEEAKQGEDELRDRTNAPAKWRGINPELATLKAWADHPY
jgi:hypothetical protein